MENQLENKSLPKASELLFAIAWPIYKRRIKTFLGILSIPLLFVIFSMILEPQSFSDRYGGIFIIGSLIFFIAMIIVHSWGQVALLYAIRDENIGIKESYYKAFYKLLSMWWVSFLMGMVVIAGLFLFIIPGIIFAIWYSMTVYVLIAEDIKGVKALAKSKSYVSGHSGDVFIKMLYFGLLSVLAYIIIDIVLWFVGLPYEGLLYWFFVTPLSTIFSFEIYKHLKVIKEGFSLKFDNAAE